MSAIEDLYNQARKRPDAMAQHMETIRKLASEFDQVAEIGIRRGSSTIALLAGVDGKDNGAVFSCDIERLPLHESIAQAAGDLWFRSYMPSEQWEWSEPQMEMLVVDGYHTYSQVKMELDRFADRVIDVLVFHDTMSCGIQGDGIADRKLHDSEAMDDTRGIRLAIDELMIRDPSWRIEMHLPNDSGLLVLRRHKGD